MIKCPFCSKIHVNNTIFCNECGKYLLEEEKRDTDPLEIEEIGWVGDPAEEFRIAAPLPPDFRPRTIRLKIDAGRRDLEVRLNRGIHIGRQDPVSTIFPEIDLTGAGNPAKSVSRRHARILNQGNTMLVEDLGSVNGTFINGKRLDPYLPETLHDGDTLQLGRLLIEIKLE